MTTFHKFFFSLFLGSLILFITSCTQKKDNSTMSAPRSLSIYMPQDDLRDFFQKKLLKENLFKHCNKEREKTLCSASSAFKNPLTLQFLSATKSKAYKTALLKNWSQENTHGTEGILSLSLKSLSKDESSAQLEVWLLDLKNKTLFSDQKLFSNSAPLNNPQTTPLFKVNSTQGITLFSDFCKLLQSWLNHRARLEYSFLESQEISLSCEINWNQENSSAIWTLSFPLSKENNFPLGDKIQLLDAKMWSDLAE